MPSGMRQAAYARLFLGCLDVTLTEEEVKYLEEPYQPSKISGHM